MLTEKPDDQKKRTENPPSQSTSESKPSAEKQHLTEEERHQRLLEEKEAERLRQEKLKDYRRHMVQHGKHLFDRKRKDKFLGGTKGRRGG